MMNSLIQTAIAAGLGLLSLATPKIAAGDVQGQVVGILRTLLPLRDARLTFCLLDGSDTCRKTTSGAGGRFVLRHVRAGDYRLSLEWGLVQLERTVTLPAKGEMRIVVDPVRGEIRAEVTPSVAP
jgi:hypothetical protein